LALQNVAKNSTAVVKMGLEEAAGSKPGIWAAGGKSRTARHACWRLLSAAKTLRTYQTPVACRFKLAVRRQHIGACITGG